MRPAVRAGSRRVGRPEQLVRGGRDGRGGRRRGRRGRGAGTGRRCGTGCGTATCRDDHHSTRCDADESFVHQLSSERVCPDSSRSPIRPVCRPDAISSSARSEPPARKRPLGEQRRQHGPGRRAGATIHSTLGTVNLNLTNVRAAVSGRPITLVDPTSISPGRASRTRARTASAGSAGAPRSPRPGGVTGAVCGALVTRSGSLCASAAIAMSVSANASSVSIDSVSVGSMSIPSSTISGK